MGAATCAVESEATMPGGPVATIPHGAFEAARGEDSQRRLGAVAEVLCDMLTAAMTGDPGGERAAGGVVSALLG